MVDDAGDDTSLSHANHLTKERRNSLGTSRVVLPTNGTHYILVAKTETRSFGWINGRFTHFLHGHSHNLFLEHLYK